MDFSVEEIEKVLDLADDIIADRDKYSEVCKKKTLATLFFEPSTRTRLSFEAAMLELGGKVLGFSEAMSSSASKGESLSDTVRTVECYADIIAMRHPKEGSAYIASKAVNIPVVNAGDGGHQHPTQTLTDLLTIRNLKSKSLGGYTIGLCGDLKFGRTVHSLIQALSRYKDIKFVLISPEELKLPRYVKEFILDAGMEYVQYERLDDCMDELDVLYMTRVQRERFFNEEEYIRLKDTYILNMDKLKRAKKDLVIMHPLPRVNEISAEIDGDPRACYFKQVLYGKFVRMALIMNLLEV